MIELTTGTPGAGKTLYTLQRVKEWAERDNRPVRYSGVPGLTLGWVEIDALKWFEAEPNSIVVIDECQRVFRPRSFGADVPDYVSRLETHRHQGIDLVFITQHPMLIDTNIRRLVGRHFHVVRRFGLARATVLEFESCKDNPLVKSVDAIRHSWAYPKKAYGWYKSAEVHTHKARIPARVWLLVALPFIIGAIMYSFYQRRFENGELKNPITGTSSQQAAPGSSGGSLGANDRVKSMTPIQYIQAMTPRMSSMPHTAAMFDEVTKPVRAPYPVGCVETKSGCRCFAETGVRYWADTQACRQIMAGGFFKVWDEGKESTKAVMR